MSDEEFTQEEAEAMKAMEGETGPEPSQSPPEEQRGEAEPEKPQEAPKEPEKPSTPEGYVPHAALHAERERRKELQQRLEALEQRLSEPEKPKGPEYVDPLQDPDGFREWVIAQEKARTDQIQQFQQQRQQQEQQAREHQEVAQLEQQFAAQHSDYADAVAHLHNARVADLRNMGYSDAEIGAQIQQDARNVVQAARAAQMNPAELLYYRAKAAGFQAPAPAAPQVDVANRITAQAKAQAQTRTLQSAGGAPASGGLTAAQLAEMSEDEFAKLSSSEVAKALGG